jgi:myo-inositol 2-dehydrogenase/D-chiro-inositol 1-dehydrogenase
MIDEARIASVFDVNRERAQQFAAQHDARCCETAEGCLEGVDACYVLTPPSFHRAYVIQAIKAGKHVLCEKPLSISLEDAEAIAQAAAAAPDIKMMTAFNMRFREGFKRLREMAMSGELGTILSIWSQRIGMGIGQGYNWRTDPDLLCGMSIESLSHDIDFLRWTAGEVKDVRAAVLASRPDLPAFDDNTNIVLTFSNGAMGSIQASWSSPLQFNSRGVIGTAGAAYIRGSGLWDAQTFHWKTKDMAHEMIEVLNDPLDASSYNAENRHFIDCILNDSQPLVTAEDGLKALQISHAILASHRTNEVIAI